MCIVQTLNSPKEWATKTSCPTLDFTRQSLLLVSWVFFWRHYMHIQMWLLIYLFQNIQMGLCNMHCSIPCFYFNILGGHGEGGVINPFFQIRKLRLYRAEINPGAHSHHGTHCTSLQVLYKELVGAGERKWEWSEKLIRRLNSCLPRAHCFGEQRMLSEVRKPPEQCFSTSESASLGWGVENLHSWEIAQRADIAGVVWRPLVEKH